MSDWKEPKSDYTAGNQVTPAIFNELAENEKHLKEVSCKIELRSSANRITILSEMVFVEVAE